MPCASLRHVQQKQQQQLQQLLLHALPACRELVLDRPFTLAAAQDVVLYCEGKPLLVRASFQSGAVPAGARLAFRGCLADVLVPERQAAAGGGAPAPWEPFGGAAGARVSLLGSALRLSCEVRPPLSAPPHASA